MPSIKQHIVRNSHAWHRLLGWIGALALLIFALSGITHPLMSWTGPRAASFFPPQLKVHGAELTHLPQILTRHGIAQAIMVKVVPTERGAALQVTEQPQAARRYFDLQSGEEWPGYDAQQALWLARFYTGLAQAPIKAIHHQTEFDDAYPWVNRLLPVYRIRFDTPDERTAFIYTELGALAGLTNDWKTALQSIFRALHTFSWLEGQENARVLLMMALLLALLAMSATGTAMVLLIKNRTLPKQKKVHRLIGYIAGIPILLFTLSGLYHLLTSAYDESPRGLQLGPPMMLNAAQLGRLDNWLAQHAHQSFNNLSLIQGPDARLLLRASLPQGRAGQAIERGHHFDGQTTEKAALYIDAHTGSPTTITDEDMAVHYAQTRFGLAPGQIKQVTPIERFGVHYDFRNKRLPVWQIETHRPQGDRLFIDPATGMLVDRLIDSARFESYSFSFLHKWNWLKPLVGAGPRDVVIVLILIAAIIATVMGAAMLVRRQQAQRPRTH